MNWLLIQAIKKMDFKIAELWITVNVIEMPRFIMFFKYSVPLFGNKSLVAYFACSFVVRMLLSLMSNFFFY